MRSNLVGSIEALRRKVRAVAAILGDPGATEHEKVNATVLKTRLEQRLKDAGKLLDVTILDHIILGDGTNRYLSFADENYLE